MRSNRLVRRIAVVASGLTIAFAGTASAEAAPPSKGGGDSLKSANRLAVALTDQNQLVSFKVRKPRRPASQLPRTSMPWGTRSRSRRG